MDHAARVTNEQTAAGQPEDEAPLIGASDVEADAAGKLVGR